MGRTPKALNILCDPDLIEALEVQELINKGHKVTPLLADPKWDLVLGGTCWRMSKELLKYLPLAIRAAREAVDWEARKATKGKKEKKG